ncbi:MAG: DUF262 domain-containing protein [Candidatus Thiodiazotropha sp. (ex Epidulcina cf. delphinae)]|nr:DUF262 domain-containing protein [Candidatus Thiodiazotropha sp. (ex Epidulcina cf. delphinae)]
MNELPKPNTQALSWFYGEHKKGTLNLEPKYQRNPIWSIGQKCFLIDSLISDCPIPQVFLNIQTKGSGSARKTIYEVVDGQQRLRAILEFMEDAYSLVETTAKSYPVSTVYKPHIGKLYSELPNELQEKMWNYPLAVQELRGWGAAQIRSLFRRLNYVVEKLNKQEMRHSQYFGEFVTTVEKLAQESFWDSVGFFTRRDSQRMKDVEYISELFVIVIDDIQDQQRTLDDFYADYDVVFPKKAHYVKQFKRVLSSLDTISDVLVNTRFKKKADFYALFAAAYEFVKDFDRVVDLVASEESLRKLSDEISDPPEKMNPSVYTYYSTVIEGPNKLTKRKQRKNYLYEMLLPLVKG